MFASALPEPKAAPAAPQPSEAEQKSITQFGKKTKHYFKQSDLHGSYDEAYVRDLIILYAHLIRAFRYITIELSHVIGEESSFEAVPEESDSRNNGITYIKKNIRSLSSIDDLIQFSETSLLKAPTPVENFLDFFHLYTAPRYQDKPICGVINDFVAQNQDFRTLMKLEIERDDKIDILKNNDALIQRLVNLFKDNKELLISLYYECVRLIIRCDAQLSVLSFNTKVNKTDKKVSSQKITLQLSALSILERSSSIRERIFRLDNKLTQHPDFVDFLHCKFEQLLSNAYLKKLINICKVFKANQLQQELELLNLTVYDFNQRTRAAIAQQAAAETKETDAAVTATLFQQSQFLNELVENDRYDLYLTYKYFFYSNKPQLKKILFEKSGHFYKACTRKNLHFIGEFLPFKLSDEISKHDLYNLSLFPTCLTTLHRLRAFLSEDNFAYVEKLYLLSNIYSAPGQTVENFNAGIKAGMILECLCQLKFHEIIVDIYRDLDDANRLRLSELLASDEELQTQVSEGLVEAQSAAQRVTEKSDPAALAQEFHCSWKELRANMEKILEKTPDSKQEYPTVFEKLELKAKDGFKVPERIKQNLSEFAHFLEQFTDTSPLTVSAYEKLFGTLLNFQLNVQNIYALFLSDDDSATKPEEYYTVIANILTSMHKYHDALVKLYQASITDPDILNTHNLTMIIPLLNEIQARVTAQEQQQRLKALGSHGVFATATATTTAATSPSSERECEPPASVSASI